MFKLCLRIAKEADFWTWEHYLSISFSVETSFEIYWPSMSRALCLFCGCHPLFCSCCLCCLCCLCCFCWLSHDFSTIGTGSSLMFRDCSASICKSFLKVIMLYAYVAITTYPEQGGLHNRHLCLSTVKGGSSKVKAISNSVLGEIAIFSLVVNTPWRRISDLSFSFYKS